MANMAMTRASGANREKKPKNIGVFWAFVAIVAAALVLVMLMPAPSENAQLGARFPSTAMPDVYIRVAADRRISDTHRVKVSE